MAVKFVKAAGGCSAPALKDADEAVAAIGKMQVRTFEPSDKSAVSEAQVMIRHPNYSGMQMNQLTGLYIPAKFVREMEVRRGGDLVFKMGGRHFALGRSEHSVQLPADWRPTPRGRRQGRRQAASSRSGRLRRARESRRQSDEKRRGAAKAARFFFDHSSFDHSGFQKQRSSPSICARFIVFTFSFPCRAILEDAEALSAALLDRQNGLGLLVFGERQQRRDHVDRAGAFLEHVTGLAC